MLGLVLRQGLELTGAGIVAGLVGAIALTRVMASLLFGVSATDVVTFSAVPLILDGDRVSGVLPAGAARDARRSRRRAAQRIGPPSRRACPTGAR